MPSREARQGSSTGLDDDYEDASPEVEVLEGDFTVRAVLVGLLVGYVDLLDGKGIGIDVEAGWSCV